MKAKRLDEVLDECLSAYLERRRTIGESLSLYPDLRTQLEPLLRTALEVAGALAEPSLPNHVEERGRQRFLDSASVRRRAQALTADLRLSRRLARVAWGKPQIALLGAVFAVTFVAVAIAATALDSSSGDPPPQAGFLPATVTPAVGDLRQTQEQLRTQTLEGGEVSPAVVRELADRTAGLESQIGEFSALDSHSQLELQRALGYQYLLLHIIVDAQPSAGVAPQARRALGLTEQLAAEWGVDLPAVPSPAAASTSPAPTPAQSAGATPSPALASPTPASPATPTP
jgi:hypothetical protein